jgi:hypothetical protein
MWTTLNKGTGAAFDAQLAQLQAMVQQSLQQHQTVQQAQQRMGALLTSYYPELSQRDHPLTQATATRYSQLVADPAFAHLYAPDPNAQVVDPNTGGQYDMRLLMHAAAEARAQLAQAQAQAQTRMGAPSVGPSTHPSGPPPARHDVVPVDWVYGDGILAEQSMQEAMARAGMGHTPREQMQKILPHLPDSVVKDWNSRLPVTPQRYTA